MATQLKIDYQLSDNTGLAGEPFRGCTYEIFINGFAEDLTLYCSTSGLPAYTSNVIEVHHFNEKTKIAGKPDIGNIDITVNDVVAPATALNLWNWYLTVYDPTTGAVGYAMDYKRRGRLYQYDTKGNNARRWDCFNLWPTSYNPGTLDYSSDAVQQITMSLACDRAILAYG